MKQIPLAISHFSTPTFDSFLAGENGAAIEHLRTLAAGAAPVYLWGPSGSGKTHLLRALAAQWQREGEHVSWFDAHSAMPWPTETSSSLVVFDDCHLFDAAQQHAAFALFVQATLTGMPVAAAGRVYVFNEDGEGIVLQAGRRFQIVARNHLEERILASPALARGRLFVRTDENLYCIGGRA